VSLHRIFFHPPFLSYARQGGSETAQLVPKKTEKKEKQQKQDLKNPVVWILYLLLLIRVWIYRKSVAISQVL
jgi:hypothetical protein